MCDRLKRFLAFVSLLRVEPFMIILYMSAFFRRTPLEVLIQDKLCRNVYEMSEEFCLQLPYMTDSDPNHGIKTQILSDAVTYNMYHTWITMAPGIMWSIFLGPWIDKYINGRKAIFIIGSITQSIESAMNALNSYYFNNNINWILVSFIPYTLSGSMVGTTAYSYVAATTPTKFRTIRMSILEVLLAIAQPLGVFLSGTLINLAPVGGNGQLHNYGLIFTISSIGSFMAFLWAVFLIDQQKDKKRFEEQFSESLEILKTTEKTSETSDNHMKHKNTHPLRLLFDINNVKEIVTTCTKQRPEYVRSQIWLIIGAMFCTYFIWTAPGTYMFQFVEKVYKWDAKIYTQISSIGMIANSIVIISIAPILIKVFKLNDMFLATIGFCGSLLHLIVLGTILTPIGYFIALSLNCTATLGPIGYKTHLSKIVEPSELGKVFTLMAVIDGFAPIIASAVMTVIFEVTIDWIPGTCFMILASIAVIPIVIALIIDFLDIYKLIPNTEPNSSNEYNNNNISYNSINPQKSQTSSNKQFINRL